MKTTGSRCRYCVGVSATKYADQIVNCATPVAWFHLQRTSQHMLHHLDIISVMRIRHSVQRQARYNVSFGLDIIKFFVCQCCWPGGRSCSCSARECFDLVFGIPVEKSIGMGTVQHNAPYCQTVRIDVGLEEVGWRQKLLIFRGSPDIREACQFFRLGLGLNLNSDERGTFDGILLVSIRTMKAEKNVNIPKSESLAR